MVASGTLVSQSVLYPCCRTNTPHGTGTQGTPSHPNTSSTTKLNEEKKSTGASQAIEKRITKSGSGGTRGDRTRPGKQTLNTSCSIHLTLFFQRWDVVWDGKMKRITWLFFHWSKNHHPFLKPFLLSFFQPGSKISLLPSHLTTFFAAFLPSEF